MNVTTHDADDLGSPDSDIGLVGHYVGLYISGYQLRIMYVFSLAYLNIT